MILFDLITTTAMTLTKKTCWKCCARNSVWIVSQYA